MKAFFTGHFLNRAILLLLTLSFSACSPTRFLSKDEALVTKVKLKGFSKEFSEQAYQYVQKDIRPNSKFNLALYNLVNTKNGKYRTDRIKNIGEAPHILDSALVDISRTQLEKFLKTKSFFNAKVNSDIVIKNKKAHLTFSADEGPSFHIRNYRYTIADSAMRHLYTANRLPETAVKTGRRYDADSLAREREQVFLLMKRNGYFDYLRQYVRFEIDSNLSNSQADVHLFLDNPSDSTRHKVYSINNTYINIRKGDGLEDGNPDTATIDSQFFFRDFSHRFKPSALSRYIFYNKGDLYNLDKENLTYERLYSLNVFKNLKIEYVKAKDSTILSPKIEAIPLKKMSNRIEGEYTFNSGRNGFNIGNTFTNRNLFGGAEQLEIKLRYGNLYDTHTKGVFNQEFQVGANLIFPKLLIPFNTRKLEMNGLAHTTFSSSLQVFDQVHTFSNRTFINSLTYDWVENRYKLHTLTPINVEYRDGRFDPLVAEALRDSGFVYYVNTNNRRYFSLGSQYTFTYNALRLSSYDNFLYFRGLIDMAGNTLGLLSKTLGLRKDPATGTRTIFGLPYIQYAKTELDLRWYRYLGKERQLILRLNPGIGYPYGNNRFLPFEKNFYAGGSSGIRAWQARTLGPGNYNREVLQNDTLRKNLRNLDQLGEIKFEGNLEYRFKILNDFFGAKLKGAAFTDFGNVWRIRQAADNPGGELKLNKLLDQIAIGAGAGLRFDVDYFVFRFDAGIKIKDPQFQGSDQWVIKKIFDQEFKTQYEQTHNPDTYRFVQYNFGIGMPF